MFIITYYQILLLLSIFYYGVTDEDGPDHDGNTNDAYDDDIGRDKECGENAEPSSPAKKRKGNKQVRHKYASILF
jgi:hypothetical protein